MKRFLICCGDATKPSTHGGLSFFLLQAAIKNKLLDGGIKLYPERLRTIGYLWNLFQLIKSGKPGGFQYSSIFNKSLFAQAKLSKEKPISILSHFPALPPLNWPNNWIVNFYIDATTSQIFQSYEVGKRISSEFKKTVIRREKEGYIKAKNIICRSKWAANSVIKDYSIDPKKVHVVAGGANLYLPDKQIINYTNQLIPPNSQNPLRLGFIGKDWERKGGPFLLEVTEALKAINIPSIIRCIGPNPTELPKHPAIQSLGFINKLDDSNRFIEELKSWHFGTLFSKAEAFGISNRECLLAGVPVITHAIGGIESTIPDSGCGKIFTPNPSAEEVAEWIQLRLKSYKEYLDWRMRLSLRSNEFKWDKAVLKLKDILD